MTSEDPWAWARDPDAEPGESTSTRSPTAGNQDADWEWARGTPEQRRPTVAPETVAAILVVHQAQGWLARTLRSLAALDVGPGVLVAVDTGSSDESAELLRQAAERRVVDRVVQAGTVDSFGAAVRAGIDDVAAHDEGIDWWWLLHDDLEPHPGAFEELLLRASEDDHPDLLFPKLLQPHRRNHPDRLAEIGSSLTPSGSRHLRLSPGEIDQRQVDSGPVLGGSTAGLLVRRSTFDELGGFDPDLPLFRDGQHLGWRANSAGARVVTAPEAALHHRQEGRFGERESALVGDAATTDRLLGMRLVAAQSDHPARTMVRLRAQAILRGLGFVLGKAPGDAMAEFRAAQRFGRDRDAVERLRRGRPERPAGEPDPARALVPGARMRWGSRLDHLTHSARQSWHDRREDQTDTGIDDLIGDDFAGGRRTRRLVTPSRVMALGVIAFVLLAWRGMFGRGRLSSAWLTPAPDGLDAAWHAWLHPLAGLGGANPGWLGLTALGSTLTGASPEAFARVLVLGAPVLGALVAHRFARRVLGDTWPAAAMALLWPAMVLLSGTTFRGSISGALATILLPLVASSAWRLLQDDEGHGLADRLRAPAAVALWLGLLAQAAPAYAIGGLGLAVWSLVRGGCDRWVPALVLTLGPILMLAPWLPRLWREPGRWLVGSDPTALTPTDPLPAWQVLLGRPDALGVPPLWLSVIVAVAILMVLVLATLLGRRRLSLLVLAGVMGTAGLALVVAAWSTRVLVRIDGYQVRPSAEAAVLVASGLGCVLAMLSLRAPTRERASSITAGQLAALVLATAVGVLAIVWTIGDVGQSPLKVRPDSLPGYVTDVQNSTRQTRTLVISPERGISPDQVASHRWSLTSAARPGWGSGESYPVLASGPDSDAVASLAAQIAQGTPSDDLAPRLARFGIGHVVMTSATDETIASISNAPGLRAAQTEDGTTVWTVQGLVSRAAMVTDEGLVALPRAVVERPGTLRLAEVPDGRWRVHIGGVEQTVRPDPSGFGLLVETEDVGELTWSIRPVWWSVVGHLVVLATLLVLAAPTIRRPGSRPPTRAQQPGRRIA